MNQAVEEGAGGDHHRSRENRPAVAQAQSADRPTLVENQIHHFRLLDVEIRLRLQHLAHLYPVLPFIALRSRNQTAGPRDVFSSRNWMPTASATSPIIPPSASTSLTRCPLAMPPMAGFYDIWAIRSRLKLNSAVRRPIRAEAIAASHPACPAPTTTMSYCSVNAMTVLF